MNKINDVLFVFLHASLVGNALSSVLYNFEAQDIELAPIYFRTAQALNITFSLAMAQIFHRLGPFRREDESFEPQGVMAFVTGIAYTFLTVAGTLTAENWGDELRESKSFHYMQSSLSVPFQAVLFAAFVNESARLMESTQWLSKAIAGKMSKRD